MTRLSFKKVLTKEYIKKIILRFIFSAFFFGIMSIVIFYYIITLSVIFKKNIFSKESIIINKESHHPVETSDGNK